MRYTPAKPTSTVAAPPTSATAAAAASGTASTQPTVTTLPPLTPAETTAIETAVKQFVQSQASMAGAVDVSTKRIDPAVDRALIHHVYEAFGHHRLSNLQKNFARQSLRNELGNP